VDTQKEAVFCNNNYKQIFIGKMKMTQNATIEKQIPHSKFEMATEYHRNFLLKSSGEDLVNAINCYIEAINENPAQSGAYYRLAVLMYENKQIGINGAIEQCKRAVELDEKNPDARMYLGYFLSLKGEKKSAREEFRKAVKLSPKKSRAKFVMALELFENKNIFKGAFYMSRACLMSIFDSAARCMLTKNILTDINYIKYSAIGKLLEKFKLDVSAYQMYSDALDITKNAPEFYEKMAKIAIKKQRPNVALQCFENASKLSNNEPSKLVNAIDFMQEAYPDKIDELIDYYNMLVLKLPEFARPYYELGHLYLKKEDYISASNAFRLALEYEKENPFYLNSLAYTYVQLEQYSSAVDLYKKAIEKNPDNEWTSVVAQALAAIYYKVNHDYEAAIAILEYALTLTKEKGAIYTLFGDIYFDDGNMDAAIKYYNMSLMDGTKDCKTYSRLAMAYWEKNSMQDAIDCYKMAIDTNFGYEIAHNNLGVIYMDSLNDINRALGCFTTAIDLNAKYTLAHFNLGRCYAELNRKIEAASEFQKAIDLNRQTNEIDEQVIQEKLYKLFET
ncbi:MAG: tetratricopeptide repeat protein, partial [Candidatus Gastranaerophilales bacterium]|nr:tetratricopeptide repeat protein [Candidatus Gastranaerophilales bacterium]